VNLQTESLINQSEGLAEKYLNERDELICKTQNSVQTKRKVEKRIAFLEKMLKIPENIRQDIT
jgi:hypothetical protein